MSNINYATSIEKKRELESLKSQVNRTQARIKKLDANVSGLNQKLADFTLFMNNADANDKTAADHLAFINQVLNGIGETIKKTEFVIVHTQKANRGINDTAKEISGLINQLVYSVELIDALALSIDKQKAANNLIPGDLVAAVTTASADANNAVALCLTALESCNLAMTTSNQSNEITLLEYQQSMALYGLITGLDSEVSAHIAVAETYHNQLKNNPAVLQATLNEKLQELQAEHQRLMAKSLEAPGSDQEASNNGSLLRLLNSAKAQTKTQLAATTKAKQQVDKELAQAKGELDRETVTLDSLQAGFAAANAAALAA
jgi:septal ring factor EnvC (AmiA/AmiB activator)